MLSCKEREQFCFSKHIFLVGIEMLPCSICAYNKTPCVIVSKVHKCLQYYSLNSCCSNALLTLLEYKRFKQEEEHLAQELIFAREAAIAAQAKTIYLKKLQHSLKSCSREMLYRGLNTLDELEEAERREQEEHKAQERATQANVSLDALFLELANLSSSQREQVLLVLNNKSVEQPISQT